MKKIILLALVALIMFAMVSCDGAINSDISGDAQKTITFYIMDFYTFEGGAKELVMEVPSGCETWEDWINKGCTVNVYYNQNGYWTCNLMKVDGYDYAYFGDGNDPFINITEGGLKGGYPTSVNLDDNIKDGGSYTLIVFNG